MTVRDFMKNRLLRLPLIGTLLAVVALAQDTPATKVAPDLKFNESGLADVIVQFREGTESLTRGRRALAARGVAMRRDLGIINAGLYRLTEDAVAQLAENPDVVAIHPDREVSATGYNGKLDYGWMRVWNVTNPNAVTAQGGGIGVAILDSGIDGGDVSLSNSGPVYSQDFTGSGDTMDWYGHGVHVAGIVAGTGAYSTGSGYSYKVRGVAPAARILNFKVLDDQGKSTDSRVIAAIDRVIALRASLNIRVMNLSLGRPVTTSFANDPLCAAVERAWRAGIVVVVSAGNDGRNNSAGTKGYGTIGSPGNSPFVITVGAMNTNGTLARNDDLMTTFSSKGPTMIDRVIKPDLVAPGAGIISNRPWITWMDDTQPDNRVPNRAYCPNCAATASAGLDYFQMSGTSMAAPFVAGAAAILLERNPLMTPDQVKARLMKTANKTFPVSSTITVPGTNKTFVVYSDIFTVGAGTVDLDAALRSADLAPTNKSARSPLVTYNAATRQFQMVRDTNLIWGDSLIWGNNLIWGDSVISGSNLVWGDNLIWGDRGPSQGFNLLWGDTSRWAAAAPDSDTLPVLIDGDK